MKEYYVYIMASYTKTLYIGMTNDLARRVQEHKQKCKDGFTKRYNITRLVYYESTNNIYVAIEREKQLKKWRRSKKVELIETKNPAWQDLAKDW